MNRESRLNAVRSGIVVISALAFGYLTFQIGFKPYLQKAELLRQQQEAAGANTEETLTNDSQYLPGLFQPNPSI